MFTFVTFFIFDPILTKLYEVVALMLLAITLRIIAITITIMAKKLIDYCNNQ